MSTIDGVISTKVAHMLDSMGAARSADMVRAADAHDPAGHIVRSILSDLNPAQFLRIVEETKNAGLAAAALFIIWQARDPDAIESPQAIECASRFASAYRNSEREFVILIAPIQASSLELYEEWSRAQRAQMVQIRDRYRSYSIDALVEKIGVLGTPGLIQAFVQRAEHVIAWRQALGLIEQLNHRAQGEMQSHHAVA